jgi:glutamate synthase (NADPH) large chain
LSPKFGFDHEALQRRLALGAKVSIQPIDENDIPQLQELLGHYSEALNRTDQDDVATRINALAQPNMLQRRFVKVVPIVA